MNSVLRLGIGLFIVWTFVLVSSVSAKRLIEENQKDTLQGLDQVRLVVNIGISLDGPTRQSIWKDIEEQLKEIPIRVLPEDSRESDWLPALYVDIAMLKTTHRTFFFLATARLYQDISLNRDANIHSPGITWRYWLIGEGDVGGIKERVKMVMSRFISDYGAVNRSE